MKIKLHKRFRGVLSLLVAVMLLVGVMPNISVYAFSKTVTIYFAKRMGSAQIDNDAKPFIGFWGASEGNNSYTTRQMTYVGSPDSKITTGYWTYQYTITFQNENDYGFKFLQGGGDVEGNNTKDVRGDDIKDNYLYYSKGKDDSDNKYFVGSMPYVDVTTSKVLSSAEFSSITNENLKNMNVVVDTSGTFQKNPERHYVSATLFDYFSDYELQNGATREGITTPYANWEDPKRRMQHLTFDKALSDVYGSNYSHPLYFGDIHHENDGYKFGNSDSSAAKYDGFNEGSNWGFVHGSSYKQLYHDNNSLRRNVLADYEKAIPNVATTGLYATDIGSYDATKTNAYNAKRLKLSGSGTNGGADAKWFDSDWLEGNNSKREMIGASYDVDFPFWTEKVRRTINNTTWAECTYFHIDSEEKKHALRMHKGTNNEYYLKETNEGIYNYTGNDYDILHKGSTDALTSTYGFFPFNDKSDFYNGDWGYSNKPQDVNGDLQNIMDPPLRLDRTNYGFGTYMVIPFKLNEKGTLYGTENPSIDAPITFTFSGDDDLLVYVDGNLVLDIGGNHGKVQGEINFNLQKSWVSRVKSNDNPKEYDYNFDPPKEIRSYNSDGVYNGEGEKFFGYFSSRATLSGDSTNKLKQFASSDNNTDHDGVTDISSVCGVGNHTMEIFYVERGLFDSNMEIMYNLPVIDDRSFTVNENISTTGVNEIFTNTSQTGANAGNNTGATNFNSNVAAMQFEMDVQFSKPTDGNDFEQLLDEQGNHGTYPDKYKIKTGSGPYGDNTDFNKIDTNNNNTNDTYTAQMGNGQTLKYVNDLVKPYNYNLKVSQGANFTFGGSSHAVSSLFTTSWTLAKYGSDEDENTGQGSDSGPVHTTTTNNTGTGSRPARGTKTTSTSATNNTTGFDFRGTPEHPDQIVFTNTMNTGTLTINKSFTRKSDDNAAHTFTFTVTFDNVGGLNLEEPNGTQGATNNVITTTVSVSYDGSETGNKTATVIGIPVGTQYTVTENDANPTGYMTTYSPNGIDNSTPGTVVSGNNNVGVSNSPSGDPEKIILKLIVELGSTNTLDNANDLPAVKLSVRRRTYGSSDDFAELTTVTVPKASDLSPDAQRKFEYSLNYPVSGTYTDYKDKVNASTAYEYQILAYGSDGTTLITTTNTEYGDKNGFIVNYNAGGVPAYTRNGTEAVDDTTDNYSDRVLEMGVKLTLPAQNNMPDTGRTGGYVPIVVGFIAILLAGAGYFIYKKRIFA